MIVSVYVAILNLVSFILSLVYFFAEVCPIFLCFTILNNSTSSLLISAIIIWLIHRYTVEDTGPVSQVTWTPDNRAFAVGWGNRGLAVWSASGCRLMCTIRQGSLSNSQSSSPRVDSDRSMSEPMVQGVAALAWGHHAYELYAVERGSTLRFFQFRFAKRCILWHYLCVLTRSCAWISRFFWASCPGLLCFLCLDHNLSLLQL